jgi:hypothetical protein
MITLVPPPRSLGLHSPVLGPWFSSDSVTLGLPDDDLAVSLTLAGNVEWRPPVAGFLSFFMSALPRPLGLAHLRGPSGAAFADNRLVAVFDVLPQAGERLGALMRALPTLGSPAVAARATRPPIRTFALEFTAASPGLAFLTDKLPFPFPTGVDTDEEKLAYLGLGGSAAALANAATPMRDLFRPGQTAGESQFLMRFPASTDARLWVFDSRGRAVDPGAAACWWLYLATQADNGFADLFAEGVDARTAPIATSADRLTVQLINAHEGPLDDETLARVNAGGNVAGTGAMRFRGTGAGAVALSFSDPPADAPDNLPLPRMAVLPDGRFDTTVNLFASGPVDPILRRDHARVAILSIERHLIGQTRHADAGALAPVRRRAADQERTSTRVLVDRAARPALMRTSDDVADAVMTALTLQDGGTSVSASLVAPTLGLDWGPVAGAPADVDVPTSVTLTAAAVTGAGTASGSTVAGQSALLTVDVGAAAAGGWVRCWTQGFDHEKGERFRLDGGGGIVDAAGRARVFAPLADGDATPSAPMGADVLVVTARGRRLFADQRFARPAPAGGVPVAAASASGPFLLCEEGREVAALDAATAIRSGTTVLAIGGATPALVDRLTIPAAARAAATFARAAGAGDTVRLTQPAFVGADAGDAPTALSAGGAAAARTARVLIESWLAGSPLPGMERRELVVSSSTANVSRAVVGGGPALGNRHGLLPHADGHPMCPAGPDVVAVGASIQGPAVRGIAEYVRERVSANTVALATTAAGADIAVPAAPASDSLWIAGLRTVAAGVEAEVGLSHLLDAALGDAYPFGSGLDEIRDFLSGGGVPLPSSLTDPAGRAARALDRRFMAAARGAREGATAVAAALARAEDLVVIETPALDNNHFGSEAADRIHLLETLVIRMDNRPGLRVVLCVPVFFDASVPKALQRSRDRELRRALDSLVAGSRQQRVAVFSPSAGPGRSLKTATTTVIVDDAWAMVGTTHLWRRGLSYDSSYAVAVFDDRLEAGRPQEVLNFRRQLCADRLGVAPSDVPDHPADLVDGVRALVTRGGFGRLVADRIRPPAEAPTTLVSTTFTEDDVWNPDGSTPSGLNPLVFLLQLTPGAVTEAFATP